PDDDGLELSNPASTPARGVSLKDFAIYGTATPGKAAIRARAMTDVEIDVWVHGGWEDCLRVWSTAVSFGDLTGGGGIEKAHIRISTTSNYSVPGYSTLPARVHNVVSNRGWSNATVYDLNVRICEGHAL